MHHSQVEETWFEEIMVTKHETIAFLLSQQTINTFPEISEVNKWLGTSERDTSAPAAASKVTGSLCIYVETLLKPL